MAWFDARNSRERMILGIAVIGSILWLGMNSWVWPSIANARKLAIESAQSTQTVADLRTQTVLLQNQLADPNAKAKAALEQLQKRLSEQEPQLRGAEAVLVPANKMPQFLESLLARSRSLKLVSLKTLAPEPLVSASDAKPAEGSAASGSLYKHGVEIRISGSYADLVGYLNDLEKAPQKVIWTRLELTANDYPVSTIALTVYTLSLDKSWLVI